MDLGVLEGQTRGDYFLNSIFDPSVKQCTVEAVGVGVGSPKQETVRRRRKGGKGSRFRSLLVFQRRLSADRGLP